MRARDRICEPKPNPGILRRHRRSCEQFWGFETNNEEDGGSLHILRMQEYWTTLSGATGQLYGNHYIWTFAPGWQRHLDLPGVTELGYMKNLFSSRKWFELVPDQAHAFVTGGYGKFISRGPPATKPGGRFATNDYVTAALTPDGSLGMAYLPQGGTVTVAMTRLQHGLTARWFDPTANTFELIDASPFLQHRHAFLHHPRTIPCRRARLGAGV